MRRTWLAALLLMLGLSGAWGQAVDAPAAQAPPAPHFGRGGWQIAAYLGGMVVLFGCGAWLLRNGLPSLQRNRGERKLNITETRGLGARQFLIVAEYENRKMLLGVCPGRIDYLCTLSASEPEFPNLAPEKPE